MPQKIIDLRKNAAASPAVSAPLPRAPKIPDAIEWSIPAFERGNRDVASLAFPGIAALLLVILAIFIKSYFFAVFVALAYGVLLLYGFREPRMISCRIAKEGVAIGRKKYGYGDFESFCLFTGGTPHELSLAVKSGLLPFIRMPLTNVSSEEVRATLLQFLPEKEHQEAASDQIARTLGL